MKSNSVDNCSQGRGLKLSCLRAEMKGQKWPSFLHRQAHSQFRLSHSQLKVKQQQLRLTTVTETEEQIFCVWLYRFFIHIWWLCLFIIDISNHWWPDMKDWQKKSNWLSSEETSKHFLLFLTLHKISISVRLKENRKYGLEIPVSLYLRDSTGFSSYHWLLEHCRWN